MMIYFFMVNQSYQNLFINHYQMDLMYFYYHFNVNYDHPIILLIIINL
jgi:hypothetical protein